MKAFLLLSVFFFVFEGYAQAQGYTTAPPPSSQSPTIRLPEKVAEMLNSNSNYLNPNTNSRIFDCPALLNRSWTYSNAQMVLVCGEAETACVRYGLLQQTLLLQQQKGNNQDGFSIEALKKALAICRQEVDFKMMGCAVVLNAGNESSSLLNQSGFAPDSSDITVPQQNLKKK